MSEDQSLNTKDLSSSSSSSSSSFSSIEDIISLSSEETELVENISLLSVPWGRRFPTTKTNPREQQNKLGKFWKEDISLENDDLRDLTELEQDWDTTQKLPPLDSYNINNDEIDLYQPHEYYLNHHEKKKNLKIILKTFLIMMILEKENLHLLLKHVLNLIMKQKII
jgi:hypothetical protein